MVRCSGLRMAECVTATSCEWIKGKGCAASAAPAKAKAAKASKAVAVATAVKATKASKASQVLTTDTQLELVYKSSFKKFQLYTTDLCSLGKDFMKYTHGLLFQCAALLLNKQLKKTKDSRLVHNLKTVIKSNNNDPIFYEESFVEKVKSAFPEKEITAEEMKALGSSLEYIAAEIFAVSYAMARDSGKKKITAAIGKLAIERDAELKVLLMS